MIKNWNHFDSNISHNLVEQRKILKSKNYELDSRAWSLKDWGVQPFIGQHLTQKREIDDIFYTNVKGKSPVDRVPNYQKKFTPITTYMKSLKDS